MKTNQTLPAGLHVNQKVGPSTRCALQFDNPKKAHQGLAQPDSPHSWAGVLLAATLTVASLLLCPAFVHAQGGVPLWTNRYAGIAQPDIVVDSTGNVLVTGSTTIKYSNAGLLLWTNAGGTAIAADHIGNVFVIGGANTPDIYTVAYSNSGIPLWTNTYDGGSLDVAVDIAVDQDGNVLVTGSSWNGSINSSASGDYVTIKYSSTGDPLWIKRYDGPEGNEDRPRAIAVSSNGNVFVTGYSYNSSGDNSDYATVAYSSTGDLLWENRYNGPANGFDSPFGFVVDNDGSVIVTGVGSGSGPDYATIKYSGAGVGLWTNRYNGSANGNDVGRDVAVDNSGNVFVTGDDSAGIATIKYSSAGGTLWTRRYPRASTQGLIGAIAVDGSGNVFVIGNTSSNSVTIAYSNAGTPLWTNRLDGQLSQLALDRAGNVFVTGNGTNSDFVTIKYSSSIPTPRLDFQKLNNQLVLSWTNAAFNLQSAPFTSGTFTNIPDATSPYTNAFNAPQQYYRLGWP